MSVRSSTLNHEAHRQKLCKRTQMKNELNNFSLTLEEIASWHDIPEITERCEVRASVPVLQRGLVWNPAQIAPAQSLVVRLRFIEEISHRAQNSQSHSR